MLYRATFRNRGLLLHTKWLHDPAEVITAMLTLDRHDIEYYLEGKIDNSEMSNDPEITVCGREEFIETFRDSLNSSL